MWCGLFCFVYSVHEKAEYNGVNALLSSNIQRQHGSHNVMTDEHLYRFANCLAMLLIKMSPFCVDPAFCSLGQYHLVTDQ